MAAPVHDEPASQRNAPDARGLTREKIERFRERIVAWIPGRVSELFAKPDSEFANDPELAIQQINALCDLALRALEHGRKEAK